MSTNARISVALAFSIGLPILGSVACAQFIPDWRFTHLPLHALVETLGGVLALVIAGVTLSSRQELTIKNCARISAALASMGLLDIFHAGVSPGPLFVWFHSLAQFFGGICFSLIVLPERWENIIKPTTFFFCVFGLSAALGLGSLLCPQMVPQMVLIGEFTLVPRALNIAGGIGFLIACGYFISVFKRNRRSGEYYFILHTALFGVAGLLFEFSVLWDGAWWWWHALRLLAYCFGFAIAVLVFLQQKQKMIQYSQELESHVIDLEYTKNRAEIASRAKSEFLSQMTHEFRTPLNSILGFCQLILHDKLRPIAQAHKDSIMQIQQSGSTLLSLVSQILDLARVESGRITSFPQPVEVSYLAYEVVEMMKPIAKQGNVLILNTIQETNDMVLYCDRLHLKQILVNLVSNAIKYNVDGGTVTLTNEINPGGTGTILVRDTGIGIDPADMKKIFNSFERLNQDNSNIAGSGVGLAIVKKLVESMGGQIGVSPNSGRGTTFFVILPLVEDHPQGPGSTPSSAGNFEGSDDPSGGFRI